MNRLLRCPVFILALVLVIAGGCGEENGEQPGGNDSSNNQCQPASCGSLGVEGGDHSDGCNGTIGCGQCAAGMDCINGQCIDDSPVVVPEMSIQEAPDGRTNETSATFEFSCDLSNCSVECSLNDEVESCTSPKTYEDLPDGDHHFRVRAASGDGPPGDWAEHFWTIDTEAPEVTDLFGPADPSGLETVSFDFGCSKQNCDFSCALDADEQEEEEEFEPCEPGVSFSGIEEGAHSFEVFATDDVGNEGDVAIWQWTMDPAVPDVIDLEGPESVTSETTATFSFDCSRENCDFECALDGGDFEDCESGVSYEELEDGEHVFEVRATDDEENMGGALAWNWTVDTSIPEVIFSQAPDSETAQTEATFEFSCATDDCISFQCALDADGATGSFEDCTSPQTVTELSEGTYTFHVRATNAAGTEGEASHSWTVGTGEPSGWSAVSVGGQHVCAITSEKALYCWGANDRGQLGDSTEVNRPTPTKVGAFSDWIHVSTGARHTCGIREDQSLWCWGDNGDGRLGNGSAIGNNPSPQIVATQWDWEDVSAGASHTCGVRPNGSLYCWGDGTSGQVGTSGTSGTPSRVGMDWDWRSVVASQGEHSCGLRDNDTLWCWGANDSGQLGYGSDEQDEQEEQMEQSSDVPVQVGSETDWSDVVVGTRHSCGIRELGQLWCWGDNEFAQLGEDAEDEISPPVQIGEDFGWSFRQVSAGDMHTCALRSEQLYCWGANEYGQLGDDTGEDSDEPVVVEGGWDWLNVEAGIHTTCALRDDHTLWCWGANEEGQLGDGSEDPSFVPVEISSPE